MKIKKNSVFTIFLFILFAIACIISGEYRSSKSLNLNNINKKDTIKTELQDGVIYDKYYLKILKNNEE